MVMTIDASVHAARRSQWLVPPRTPERVAEQVARLLESVRRHRVVNRQAVPAVPVWTPPAMDCEGQLLRLREILEAGRSTLAKVEAHEAKAAVQLDAATYRLGRMMNLLASVTTASKQLGPQRSSPLCSVLTASHKPAGMVTAKNDVTETERSRHRCEVIDITAGKRHRRAAI